MVGSLFQYNSIDMHYEKLSKHKVIRSIELKKGKNDRSALNKQYFLFLSFDVDFLSIPKYMWRVSHLRISIFIVPVSNITISH